MNDEVVGGNMISRELRRPSHVYRALESSRLAGTGVGMHDHALEPLLQTSLDPLAHAIRLATSVRGESAAILDQPDFQSVGHDDSLAAADSACSIHLWVCSAADRFPGEGIASRPLSGALGNVLQEGRVPR